MVTFSLAASAVLGFSAFNTQTTQRTFDEITVRQITLVDSAGQPRVLLAGGFPPRRPDLAGILFFNQDGGEAGGLVYKGTKHDDGTIDAGGILTFDQYRNDQIIAIEYAQRGSWKRNGITIQDRPDSVSPQVLDMYRGVERAKNSEERDSLIAYYLSVIPRRDIASRRLFAGRSPNGASVVTLSDADGKKRLELKVEQNGEARIVFLDEDGNVLREITP
jgi:hypothetical protein